MNTQMQEWDDAVRRADEVRERIAAFALAELAVPPELVAELALMEDEVLTKLRALYQDRDEGALPH